MEVKETKSMRVYNLIILDASGSMQSIYNQALNGVNETIQTIRMVQEEHPELKQYLTLATFNAGDKYLHKIYNATPIDRVHEVTTEDYVTRGCTALYDAMGEMISALQQTVKHDEAVLVTIITDGEENASRKWSQIDIRSLNTELRQMGWTFTYIGANQDVEEVSASIGIKNSLAFQATEEETAEMFVKEQRCRKRHMNSLMQCCMNAMKLAEDESYFD